MSEKQTIRIPKDVRQFHQIVTTILKGLPAELPLDIEVTPSNVKVACLEFGAWNPLRIKMSWAGTRIDASLRKYIGQDKTSIDSVAIKEMIKGGKGTRKRILTKVEESQLQAEYWTS